MHAVGKFVINEYPSQFGRAHTPPRDVGLGMRDAGEDSQDQELTRHRPGCHPAVWEGITPGAQALMGDTQCRVALYASVVLRI